MRATHKTQKYPKTLAKAELTLKNRHSENAILDAKNENRLLRLKELEKSIFSLVGIYPYLFDVINYACTHHRGNVQRLGDKKETHYRIAIAWESFLDWALDGYTGSGNRERLKKEVYRLGKEPLVKIVPLDEHSSIKTQLIRIDLKFEDGTKFKKNKNLKHYTGKRIEGVFLEFYKPLWRSLLKGKYGESWFIAPKAFNAKMFHAIEQYKELPMFKKYGSLAYAVNYRRLFLYLNMHDNQTGKYIKYDSLDMMRDCFPANIHKDRHGEIRERNWYKSHQFIQKALKLINKMAQDGLMENIKMIPSSVYYEKPTKEIRVKVERERPIPDFINETAYLPNGNKKN